MYEATGKIKIIYGTQTFPSGFSKREFVVTVADANYPQDLKFEVVKDKCSLLDNFQDGQEVTVNFDIRGNEYKDKYYVNLVCWKIQAKGGGDDNQADTQSSSSSEVEPSPDELVNDDIPF